MPGMAHMIWINKEWGEACELGRTPEFSVHLIRFRAGGRSSWHYHEQQSNRIACRSGVLAVEFLRRDTVHLAPGQAVGIPAMMTHRFVALSNGSAWELYRGDCREVDIVRLT